VGGHVRHLEAGDERLAAHTVRRGLPRRVLVASPPHQVANFATSPPAVQDGLYHVFVAALSSSVAFATPTLGGSEPAFGWEGAYPFVFCFLSCFFECTALLSPEHNGGGLLLFSMGWPAYAPLGWHYGARASIE
jgi:hypothetical protein